MAEIEDLYQERIHLLKELAGKLERELTDALRDIPHIDRISFRTKGKKSFAKKAQDPSNNPGYSDPLVEVEDQVAGRILVHFLSDLAVVRDTIEGSLNTIEKIERRPQRDAEFGYESDHLVCTIPLHLKPDGWEQRADLPETFELQIRTLFMHAYAEPQHDMAYKGPDDLPREVRRELAWVAASAWGADRAFARIRGSIAATEDKAVRSK